MNKLFLFFAGVAVVVAGLILGQIWFEAFSAVVFWKLMISLGVVSGLVVFVWLVWRELVGDKKMKDDGFLDG